jgi:osmotically inducible lipoprotein OsmB
MLAQFSPFILAPTEEFFILNLERTKMKLAIIALASCISITGCATNDQERRAARGALIGAAGGAIISSATGGDPWAGAAAGAAGGAAFGYVTADGKQRRLERDRSGRPYWVDERGRRQYLNHDRN